MRPSKPLVGVGGGGVLTLSSAYFLSIFDHATLKNYISANIYSSISSYTSLERAKIKLSEKKIFRTQETHNIPPKKINKAHFCLKIFSNL